MRSSTSSVRKEAIQSASFEGLFIPTHTLLRGTTMDLRGKAYVVFDSVSGATEMNRAIEGHRVEGRSIVATMPRDTTEELQSILYGAGTDYSTAVAPPGFEAPEEEGVEIEPARAVPVEEEEELPDVGLGEDTPALRPEDSAVFGPLIETIHEAQVAAEAQGIGFSPANFPTEYRARHALQQIVRYKNGDNQMRSNSYANIIAQAAEGRFTPAAGLPLVCGLLFQPDLAPMSRYVMVRLLGGLLVRWGSALSPSGDTLPDVTGRVWPIWVVIRPMLISEAHYERGQGRELMSTLAKAVDIPPIMACIRNSCESEDRDERYSAAAALAVLGTTLSMEIILRVVNALCSNEPTDDEINAPEDVVRHRWVYRRATGLRALHQLAMMAGTGLAPHAGEVCHSLMGLTGLDDDEVDQGPINFDLPEIGGVHLGHAAVAAVATVAEQIFPYAGAHLVEAVLPSLFARINRSEMVRSPQLLGAIGFTVALDRNPRTAQANIRDLVRVICNIARSDSSPALTARAMSVVRQLLRHEFMSPPTVRAHRQAWENFIEEMVVGRGGDGLIAAFGQLAGTDSMVDPAVYRAASEAADGLLLLGAKQLRTVMIQLLHANSTDDRPGVFRSFALGVIGRIFTKYGVMGLDANAMTDLLRVTVASLHLATDDPAPIIAGLAAIIGAIPDSTLTFDSLVNPVAAQLLALFSIEHGYTRARAAECLGSLAPVLATTESGLHELAKAARTLHVRFQTEAEPETVAAMLRGLAPIIDSLGPALEDDNLREEITNIVANVSKIMKNRHEDVAEAALGLVAQLARTCDEHSIEVDAREWMRHAYDMLDMFAARKKTVRRACVATFGLIAEVVGPQNVLETLLANLRRTGGTQDRQLRVCTTIAIAVVAHTCGAFTVVPYLANEYRVPDGSIQTAVLKALSFMFEYITEAGTEYLPSVTTLITNALEDRNAVHRQTACACVKHIAIHCGAQHPDIVAHLLNYVFPNILEPVPHLLNAALEAVDACRVALGAPIIMQYVQPGLFHPAKRVRDIYWQLYNGLLVADPDGMTAAYPFIPDEPGRCYSRPELDYIA